MCNKHKHYDLIVAKAENMDLVVFQTDDDLKEWYVLDRFPMWGESTNYFLCLPKHKEACLHWLNGGALQDFFEDDWTSVDDFEGEEWVEADNMFMDEEYQFRIKPKKEKRWIATLNGWNASQKVFASKQEAVDLLGANSYQFHEIEVEV